jgi:hypothetical protein
MNPVLYHLFKESVMFKSFLARFSSGKSGSKAVKPAGLCLESLDDRCLLSVSPIGAIKHATVEIKQSEVVVTRVTPDIVGNHLGTQAVTEAIQGNHIGTPAVADAIQGNHIGTPAVADAIQGNHIGKRV